MAVRSGPRARAQFGQTGAQFLFSVVAMCSGMAGLKGNSISMTGFVLFEDPIVLERRSTPVGRFNAICALWCRIVRWKKCVLTQQSWTLGLSLSLSLSPVCGIWDRCDQGPTECRIGRDMVLKDPYSTMSLRHHHRRRRCHLPSHHLEAGSSWRRR
jgi:hypothetical protein